MRNENNLEFVFSNFESLERDLIQFMDYVPYIPENYSVLSPKLNTIILESCSLAESVLKHFTVGDEQKKLNLKYYNRATEPYLELDHATSILLTYPVRLIRPFIGWNENQPKWWSAYNQLKHDRINNYKTATYEKALFSITGLHQIIVRSRLFIGNMIASGWINNTSDDFSDLLASRHAGTGPPYLPVESEIFVTPLRGDFVKYDCGEPVVDSWDFSNRVKNLIYENETAGSILYSTENT